jgi:hypothetical protein
MRIPANTAMQRIKRAGLRGVYNGTFTTITVETEKGGFVQTLPLRKDGPGRFTVAEDELKRAEQARPKEASYAARRGG